MVVPERGAKTASNSPSTSPDEDTATLAKLSIEFATGDGPSASTSVTKDSGPTQPLRPPCTVGQSRARKP